MQKKLQGTYLNIIKIHMLLGSDHKRSTETRAIAKQQLRKYATGLATYAHERGRTVTNCVFSAVLPEDI
jgi:hypothetical protein